MQKLDHNIFAEYRQKSLKLVIITLAPAEAIDCTLVTSRKKVQVFPVLLELLFCECGARLNSSTDISSTSVTYEMLPTNAISMSDKILVEKNVVRQNVSMLTECWSTKCR
jgi:hypothetical protein